MAEGLNRATLLGNLGQDPELKYTQGGSAVLKLRIATTESYLQNNERKERTDWHSVVMWGKRAEALNKILAKGQRVYIEGRIETRSWEDQSGGKRYATEINATNVILCGSPNGERREQRREESGGGYDPGHNPPDDDIPF